jgi:hypothetical protein
MYHFEIFHSIPEVNIGGRKLLSQQRRKRKIRESKQNIFGACLFDRTHTKEGDDAVIAKGLELVAVKFTNIRIDYKNYKTGDENCPIWARLETASPFSGVQILDFPPRTNPVSRSGATYVESSADVISIWRQKSKGVVSLSVGSKFGVARSPEEDILPTKLKVTHTAEVGGSTNNWVKSASLSYDREALFPAVLFKEFGPDVRWNTIQVIALKVEVPRGDEITLLIHSPTKKMYKVANTPTISESMADKPTVAPCAYYVRRNEVVVRLVEFQCLRPLHGLEISFIRNGETLRKIRFAGDGDATKIYQAGDFWQYRDVKVDLNDSPKLLVRVTAEASGTARIMQKEFETLEMTSREYHTEPMRDNWFKLSLSFSLQPPTIAYSLRQPMDREDRAVFCRVFRFKGLARDQTVRFAANEVYGVLVFTDLDLNLDPTNLYAVFALDDWTPLADARQLTKTHWLVLLNGDTLSGGKITLPFRRQSKIASSNSNIGLLHIFRGPSGGFCKLGLNNVAVRPSLMGCIEPSWIGEIFASDWTALLPVPPGGAGQNSVLSVSSTKVPIGEFFVLHLFDLSGKTPGQSTVAMWPSKFVINSGSAYIVLPKALTLAFSSRKVPLVVEAPEASGVDVYCGAKTPNPIPPRDGVFSVSIDCENVAQIVAVTTDDKTALRVFKVSDSENTLISSAEGVIDGFFQVRGTGDKMEPGFSRQIIGKMEGAWIYKTWKGSPIKKIIPNPKSIVLKVDKLKDDISRLGVVLNPEGGGAAINIPWGVRKYVKDPAGFFKSLGIATEDVVNFSPDGFINVKTGKIRVENLKNLNILDFLDF